MARLLTTGFEVQHISPTAEFGPLTGATTGTPTITTSTVRSGAAALSVPQASWWRLDGFAPTLGRSYFLRMYCRFSSVAPATVLPLVSFYGSGTNAWRVEMTTGGSLNLYQADFGAQVGSGTTLSANTWYRVEVEFNIPAASTGTLGLYVDGVQIARSTAADVNNSTTSSQFYIGNDDATGVTVFFDDVALNDDQGASQNSFPGDAKVVLLKPTSDSAVGAGWLKPGGGSTNLWTSLDSTPPIGVAHSTSAGNADRQIYNLTSTAVANYDANCTTYTAAGVGGSDVIKLVQAIGSMGSSSATDTAGAIDIVSNPDQGTETSFAAFDDGVAGTWPTTWRTVRGLVVYAPSPTLGTAPVLRVGKRTATTRVAMSSFLAIYVEYTPVVGGPNVPLQAVAAVSSGTLVLTASTRVTLGTATTQSSATLALTAPTRVILGTAAAVSSATLTLRAPAIVVLAPGSALSAATLSLTAAARLTLSATALSSATLVLSAPARVVLDPASAVSSATLAVFTPGVPIIPLAPSSAIASATLTLTAAGKVVLGPASGLSSVTLALSAPTRVVLGTASALSSGTLALTTATRVVLGTSAAVSTATLALSVATRVVLGTASAISSATLALRAPAIVVLSPASSVASATAVVYVPSSTVPLQTAAAVSSATLSLRAATRVVLDPAFAVAAATLALSAKQPVALGASSGVSSATLVVSAPTVAFVPLGASAGLSGASLVVFTPTVTFVALDAAFGMLVATLALGILDTSGEWLMDSDLDWNEDAGEEWPRDGDGEDWDKSADTDWIMVP